MSRNKVVHLVVFGIGNVGSTLIDQINDAEKGLDQQLNLEIKIAVVTNSKLSFITINKDKKDWALNFEKYSIPFGVEEVIQFVKAEKYENVIAIDATTGVNFVQNYISLIENGFHIISANKIANTLSLDFYDKLRDTLRRYNKYFLYETNVGAGLPIIETIKSLYDSGDQIERVRGVFSGSLSYIFNRFSAENVSFSNVLLNASKLGLTEPDAREDLSGNDVARKLLILARELNLKVEFEDVAIESLVPRQFDGNTTLNQFQSNITVLDAPFLQRKQELPDGKVLRYVGELNVPAKTLEVKLVAAESQSPLGQLKDADSIFEIFTESYGERPIVIQGAGAGKAVTARGLLSDIVKLSHNLN
ncbi:MAG: aspartate kinase [Flavobacterium sp. MedPE-SWcel]|uniref:aspartate kinase n=1 Tax=uncultured Flavobacterium sp. TaxID=165435 RepID=UPI000923EDF3|nr:aspartate kinase [uncultured Flavobacterium sp.]OIQ22161.1 MAG: aspartate kinase [Flavobacterium sp. MedPE-SWcel]